MKILLIGKTGQLGQALHRELISLGEMVALGRSQLDLVDQAAVRRAIRDTRPQVVVNAAAYTNVDEAETEPEMAKAVNQTGPGVLARAARDAGAALVHYSTDYVFDGKQDQPYREDDLTAPMNAYGASKLAGEEEIHAAGAAHLVLRVSWLYSATGRNFLNTMLRLGRESESLRVVNDQIGAPSATYVVAAATREILVQGKEDPRRFLEETGGTYHLACRGHTSWKGFADEIFRIARERNMPLRVKEVIGIPTTEYPLPAARPKNSRLDISAIRSRFGVQLPHWKEALEHVFDELSCPT